MKLPCGNEKPISDCVNYCNIKVDECMPAKDCWCTCGEKLKQGILDNCYARYCPICDKVK